MMSASNFSPDFLHNSVAVLEAVCRGSGEIRFKLLEAYLLLFELFAGDQLYELVNEL